MSFCPQEKKIRMDLFNLNSEWMIEETKVEKATQKYPFYDTEFSGELKLFRSAPRCEL